MRIVVIVVIFILYFSSLLYKNHVKEKNQAVIPPTIFQIRSEQGTPVRTEIIKKGSLDSYYKVSGFIAKSGILKAEVTNEVVTNVEKGYSASFYLDNKEYRGHIINVGKKTNLLSGLYSIEIKFNGFPLEMVDKITVAHIPYKSLRNVTLIPRVAVSFREKEPIVYVVENEKVIKRKISIIDSNSDYFAIRLGVSRGDHVVTSDQRYLTQNEKIKIIK